MARTWSQRQSAEARLCELRRVSCELSFRMLTCCDFECHDRMSSHHVTHHWIAAFFVPCWRTSTRTSEFSFLSYLPEACRALFAEFVFGRNRPQVSEHQSAERAESARMIVHPPPKLRGCRMKDPYLSSLRLTRARALKQARKHSSRALKLSSAARSARYRTHLNRIHRIRRNRFRKGSPFRRRP